MQRFRDGLVFKAHRLCVSLHSRLESNKEEEKDGADCGFRFRGQGFGFRVSGVISGCGVQGLWSRFRVPGFVFQVSDSGVAFFFFFITLKPKVE